MKHIMKYFGSFVFCLLFASGLFAQENNPAPEVQVQECTEAYDPLIPQQFAFDKANQVFVGINLVNNTIDLIEYKDGKLNLFASVLVDVFEKRHDVHAIYRAQSVAIYDNSIVYLASHRDSCFLSVLDLKGKEIARHYFVGKAYAFSYSAEAKELYIAGQNDLGYDIAVMSTANGFDKLDLSDSDLSLNYRRPKKAEAIKETDPYGIGLAVIAMSVVFLGLLLLYLCFKGLGNFIISLQRKRAEKDAVQRGESTEEIPCPVDVSGDIYAAIATAIYMYASELHDEENTVITIEKVSKTYSPWSSKLYGLNTYFNNRR